MSYWTVMFIHYLTWDVQITLLTFKISKDHIVEGGKKKESSVISFVYPFVKSTNISKLYQSEKRWLKLWRFGGKQNRWISQVKLQINGFVLLPLPSGKMPPSQTLGHHFAALRGQLGFKLWSDGYL